jgi:hypothetical protein
LHHLAKARFAFPPVPVLLFAPPRHEMMWMDSTGRQREDLFAKELWSRFDRPGAPAWQWRMALDSATFLRTRPTWAVDEPFAVRLNLPEWLNVGSVELEPEGLERSWRLVVSSVSARRAWHAIGYVTPGVERVKVVIVPVDFRKESVPGEVRAKLPSWVASLYEQLASEMRWLPGRPM